MSRGLVPWIEGALPYEELDLLPLLTAFPTTPTGSVGPPTFCLIFLRSVIKVSPR